MAKPSISVIIPVYNAQKYLRRCLDSVVNQTFTDWQAICVNDGSTDDSGKILREYAARDARFVIIDKKNAGVSRARNTGLSAANGEFILFLDSDDFIHPQTMEITRRTMLHYGVDLVVFRHDRKYYNQLRGRTALGINSDDFMPETFKLVYDAPLTEVRLTHRLIDFATERSHKLGMWYVRHCYPVMYLYRHSFIKGMRFPTDISIAEDFPWTTELLVRNPYVAITRLPLYYYAPNEQSALGSAGSLRMTECICRGMMYAYANYCANAPIADRRRFCREFIWPFAITAMREARTLSGAARDTAREYMAKLYATGMLDTPVRMRDRKYKRRIRRFIAEK